MENKHISQPEYDQLSDREKAEYREQWELEEPITKTYFKAPTQPGDYRGVTFEAYIEFQSPVNVRRVYVPIHPIPEAMTKEQLIIQEWKNLVGEDNMSKLNLDENGFSDWRCRRLMQNSSWDNLYSKIKYPIKGKYISGGDLIYRPKTLKDF